MLLQQATILHINQNNTTIIQIITPSVTPSFFPISFSDLCVGIGSIISGIALILVLAQVFQTRSEMNNKLRPWVGVSHINFLAPDPKIANSEVQIEFEYTNFGDVPATNFKPCVKWSNDIIDISEKIEPDRIIILMPQQKSYMGFAISAKLFQEIELGIKPLYVLITFTYTNARDNKDHYIKNLYNYHTTGKVLNLIKSEIDH